jgi:hypothetical protein
MSGALKSRQDGICELNAFINLIENVYILRVCMKYKYCHYFPYSQYLLAAILTTVCGSHRQKFKYVILSGAAAGCSNAPCSIFLLLVGWDEVPCTAATSGLFYQPQMIGEGDCGAIGGMKIGKGNRSTRRKPALAPLCPPQIPLDQTRDRTRAAAVGSQRLTA